MFHVNMQLSSFNEGKRTRRRCIDERVFGRYGDVFGEIVIDVVKCRAPYIRDTKTLHTRRKTFIRPSQAENSNVLSVIFSGKIIADFEVAKV